MSNALPRLVIAGTRSGVGKTTVATGLMAALSRRGLAVSGHKVGPDFIDPGYHALATGRPPRNLDVVLHGADRVAPLLAHGAAGADVAVVEGVMGLFDGRRSDDEASTAHVARLLRAPVLLVVDVSGSSRSVAAEVHGFATFDPAVHVAGVVLNRVGSPGHERLVRDALATVGVPVVGALGRDDAVAAPSRHLGLVPAIERDVEARRAVDVLADRVDEAMDLDAVLAVARSAPPLRVQAWDPGAEVGRLPGPGGARPRVALAGGRAFSFTYTEHLELLAAAGAEVERFDPLRDERLPEHTDAVVLGGGFPEVHVSELAANAALGEDLRRAARAGRPIVAECGGLLYLCRELDGIPMVGLVDATATFTDGLTLGYRDAVTASPSILGPPGTAVTGHEFHRTVVAPRAGAAAAWRLSGRTAGGVEREELEGFVAGSVHASYLHAGWVGAPGLPRELVRRAGNADATLVSR